MIVYGRCIHEKEVGFDKIRQAYSFRLLRSFDCKRVCKSDLVQSIIWCALGVALLCVILDDSKQIQRIMGYYNDAMQRNMILATLPDEITERLEDAEFCDEDLKEQFNAIVWECILK